LGANHNGVVHQQTGVGGKKEPWGAKNLRHLKKNKKAQHKNKGDVSKNASHDGGSSQGGGVPVEENSVAKDGTRKCPLNQRGEVHGKGKGKS